MTETMKAAVVRAFGEPLSIEALPLPEPKDGEVLVKIRASGVCHTDLHAASGDWPVKPELPAPIAAPRRARERVSRRAQRRARQGASLSARGLL